MFCQKKQNSESLPPTSDSLHFHIERFRNQAHVWRRALVATQDLLSPVGHGWKSYDDQLYPMLMTKGPALASLMELTCCPCGKTHSVEVTAHAKMLNSHALRPAFVWAMKSAKIQTG